MAVIFKTNGASTQTQKTPAYEMEDGVDYVPADTNVVFGHQFASIAGAGPINGPIQAAIFGWVLFRIVFQHGILTAGELRNGIAKHIFFLFKHTVGHAVVLFFNLWIAC